jgi:hypothetical protein
MPAPLPQVVNTTVGSTSYVRLYGYQYSSGMTFTAYDGMYNWAAAPVSSYTGPDLVVSLTCLGPYRWAKERKVYADGGMTITIINPPNAPIPVVVAVFYVAE